jgi:indole-3-acetate monooxygenase
VRGFILPARDWQIEDTWHAAGLRGTGSHDIILNDAAVPEANVFDPVGGLPCMPGPLYSAVFQTLPLMHGALSVGMATGALDDRVALANTERQQLGALQSMRDSEVLQNKLGHVAADIRAAQGFLQVQADIHWRHAIAGTLKDEARLTEAGQAAAWLAEA